MHPVEHYLEQSPLIAILRGITPGEAIEHATAIYDAGWRCLEIPLNSPRPLESIRLLADHFGDRMFIGAGTVITREDVTNVAKAGGQFIVAPNMDQEVILAALAENLDIMPGVMTASEAFNAYKYGARYLKLFPADSLGPSYIKALMSVLPKDAKIIPVGGVSPANLKEFAAVGCAAYGIGSQLYKKGMGVTEVEKNAREFTEACKAL